jgi:ribosomal protein S18 acetylase RimI-like enzyme
VIEIRPDSPADAPAIARVRRESWFAAYEGIIATPVIDRATAASRTVTAPPPYRRTLVAAVGEQPAVVGYASYGPERAVASLSPPPSPLPDGHHVPSPGAAPATPAAGPHPPAGPGAADSRMPAGPGAAGPHPPAGVTAPDPLTPAGRAGGVGELYALYVTPAWWSAGVGRALMGSVLSALEDDGYRRVVLWVLADNARARRFYERAGFAADGGTNILTGLGGVLEIRYTRDF